MVLRLPPYDRFRANILDGEKKPSGPLGGLRMVFVHGRASRANYYALKTAGAVVMVVALAVIVQAVRVLLRTHLHLA